jgi:hypothetical protein
MPVFGNVLLPDITADQMRGVWALLDLISTPKSQEAQDFMRQLAAIKDAAVAAAAKAQADRTAADELNRTLGLREAAAATVQREAADLMAQAKTLKADLDAKHAKYMQIFRGI